MIHDWFSSVNKHVPFNGLLSALIVVYLVLLPSVGRTTDQINYRIFMYKNNEVAQPTTLFSPHDKIVVYIKFFNLPGGEYTFHADWYNSFGELQDSSNYSFALPGAADHAVESSMGMSKAGFLTRLFSVSETTGYSVKFYGKWQVKLFLNGDEVAGKSFEVR